MENVWIVATLEYYQEGCTDTVMAVRAYSCQAAALEYANRCEEDESVAQWEIVKCPIEDIIEREEEE